MSENKPRQSGSPKLERGLSTQLKLKETLILLAVGIGVVVILGIALNQPEEPTQSAVPAQTSPAPLRLAPTQTQEEPAPSPEPEYRVGDMVDVGQFEVGVADGKMIEHDGQSYLAIEVFVRNTSGMDMLGLELKAFTLRDSSGLTSSNDSLPVIINRLPYLSLFTLGEGDSTVGWLGFEVSSTSENSVLMVSSNGSATSVKEISLEGVLNPDPNAEASVQAAAARDALAVAEDRGTVTMNEYQQVKEGMSLKQAQEIIGFEGDESASSGGHVIRSWANSDGSNMSVTFYQGRMQSKAQAGL